ALDKARDYAAEDADYTLRLHRLLKPRLLSGRHLAFYETTERAMPEVVAQMEAYGIKVDATQLRRASEDFAKRMGELEVEIHSLAGHPFNIASPQQLGKVLFDELKLASGRKTKTGAYGTDADVLEELASEHALPARVLDWRQLSKLKSTYADALVAQINPRTGRVHTSYSLAGASTGRLASTDPNLQNIPVRTEEGRKIRHAFIAEKGHVLLSADYSQIELRLAAHVADVAALKQAFAEGIDIHAATASEVFGVPVKGMDPNLRRRAKAINFGILYGISAFGLASQIDVPQAEAAQYIKAYFQRFPGIRDYMEETKAFAREHGYVETIFGRRCYLRGIKDANQSVRGFSERAAINAPLQGAAADIIKRAMRRIPPALEKAGLSARMLLQVHDELVFEVAEKEVDETAALVKRVMECAAMPVVELSVPLVVDTGSAKHWDEAH
ncbi:MAG: DNA polymerase I, partial [Stellaceae bacterium]